MLINRNIVTGRSFCVYPCIFFFIGLAVERAPVFETVIGIAGDVSMMTDRETAGSGAEMVVIDTETVKIDTETETPAENDIGMKEIVPEIIMTEVETGIRKSGHETVRKSKKVGKMNSIQKHLIVNMIVATAQVVIMIAILGRTSLSAGDHLEGVVVSSLHFSQLKKI